MAECLYIFDNLEEISRKIKSSEKILLGMDHDGTLAEIVTTMQEARMTEQMKNVVYSLCKNPKMHIAIVSGREISNLKDVVKIEIKNIFYIGNHGFEIKGYGKDYTFKDKSILKKIKEIAEDVEKTFKDIDGFDIEKKGFTTSFHFRKVKPEFQDYIRNEILRTLKKYKDIRIVEGKKLFNIRPNVNINKGIAINIVGNHFYKNDWRKHITVVYIGDDNSDEDAFKILEDKDIGIVVNESPPEDTNAGYYLKSVKEVEDFLKLVNEI